MSLTIGKNTIARVDIVDDKADVRRAIAMSVDEADLRPVIEDKPLPALKEFVAKAVEKADAAICDYRLNLGTYARFNGAEAIAAFYDRKWPALLCTSYGRADIDAMRAYRRKIPRLIRTDDLNPDTIVSGLEYCLREFRNDYSPERKPWRTLVRIEDVDMQLRPPMFYVVLPGWYSSDKIRLSVDLVPTAQQDKIRPGVRFHAWVNKGAEDQNDLYIDNFEFD